MARRLLLGNMKKEKEMLLTVVNPSIKSFLDLGCGTGEFCEVISPKIYHGIDIDARGIDQARILHPRYKFSKRKTGFKITGKYDLVALIGTVHHLSPKDFRSMLGEILGSLLTKDGKLLIMDPLHEKEQKQFLGKLVFSNDRGNFHRTREQVVSEIRCMFNIIRYETYQERMLTFYLLVGTPIRKGKKFRVDSV